ncbi:MAG: Fe-S cluster assembly protein SufD [Bacteroidaceae bacterium]|nr:Fe-S cluster assembly protein SufD [Bacteroidaceae bacterium]
MTSEQQYIELYREASDLIKNKSCGVMNAVRDEAFETFQQLGFPSKKVERYRYTDVDAAFAPNYGISFAPLTVKPSLYIFNIKDAPIDVAPYYHKVADRLDAITALNTALVHDALLVYVPKNTKVTDPIVVDNWLRGMAATMMNRRILIVMEQGADATIIINDHAADKQRFLTTQVIEVFCHDNARLDLYEIEETTPLCSRFSNVYIHEGRDCSVKHNSITLFNGQTRNLCDVYLRGENSEVTLNGCAIGSGSQRIDNNTLIRHEVPHCTSSELYKYVVDDKSVGAFAGKILVEKDAQKTESQETNANLCASSEARMYTQPMLEIYADDVKCAHGSTVGVMDEVALFYMRQRGIPEAEARTLLKNAFMGQVIDQIKNEPLRQRLYVKVEKRFRGELDKCDDCRLCK